MQNLHTHCSFCDGSDTPEELVLEAIRKGMTGLGVSCHSYTWFSPNACLQPEHTARYQKEISRLKEKYREQLSVFCGLEYEMFSVCDTDGYDYLIGSSHFLKIGEEYVLVDVGSEQELKAVINRYFDGNAMNCVRAYYEGIAHLSEYGPFDMVGHFDVISKFGEKSGLFDLESKVYRNIALESLHELSRRIPVFEVNTRGFYRGYRSEPYPAPFILKELKNLGCSLVLSSDCHEKELLDGGFVQVIELIKSCGFTELMELTENGLQGRKI